ncbi:NADH-dependent butanol dehydrogenase a [Campylobacter hyointestinalis]|uniref:iron-containing alcohol dehydrogenase family protein n=1 Tax=Campylobacter hyointestinalis TaxID=198 RepID=UPI0007265BFC|nr:iron-containing alcohol dehydrogenase family protein [Campylobacter hyointestinalis]PPB54470.1 alcohol dehydrogenase [Campylobacter hyointestinalis subsp. hyointestinalis]PPB61981.1 alcohol dehydrogenase [Campylobacter hyointestinalis subsp. hyointestinalis]PPB63385.1 alcohol dehydrogenase [Campylobacter hyointestinalis subsp. hyointestinalis]CUU69625.1 NADH-dependent butanol dehydrogenase a [Campylobacter hyointestinalis subsp. hyointestinalis]CUU73190.1 NADH-dependent butanol dehydrogenas
MNNSKNVLRYMFGSGAISNLSTILNNIESDSEYVIYYIDEYFKNSSVLDFLPIKNIDEIFFVQTQSEPETSNIDHFRDILISKNKNKPKAIIAIGGGCTLDTGKAIANLLTNSGNAEDYQGWDLVKNPGIYKIGIPTISGTGAEASRTCVMINPKNGLKLGMNSDFTIYDQLILDPNLTKSVPRNQYFYTGMDTYLHCIESLNGSYRNSIGDAFSHQAISLCREVFLSDDDMMSDKNREKLMVASYLGGCAIANSFVGIVHPFSAGLSVVLGTHHCVGNCITMNAMEEFYPQEFKEFILMGKKQGIEIPQGIAMDLDESFYKKLYDSTIIHEKPLSNALGANFKNILTYEKVKEIFKKM